MSNNKLQINWDRYTTFEQKVYKVLLKIPKGRVLTYSEVARKIGNPKAYRAVANACARNEHAPFIPCHRVVGKNSLGGYSGRGGLKTKIRLLRAEGYKLV
jgi:methylated-DNA-[protein]-cysteine S-methyltransferase